MRWRFAGDRISGSASVVDLLVYFSSFAHRTYALAVVAAPGRLYLVGRGRIYALAPR